MGMSEESHDKSLAELIKHIYSVARATVFTFHQYANEITRRIYMGEVSATITLMNAVDVGMVRRGLMKAEEVRQTTVTAIVDIGSTFIVINEALRVRLGLQISRSGSVGLAGGQTFRVRLHRVGKNPLGRP
jgi:hypothetical protein